MSRFAHISVFAALLLTVCRSTTSSDGVCVWRKAKGYPRVQTAPGVIYPASTSFDQCNPGPVVSSKCLEIRGFGTRSPPKGSTLRVNLVKCGANINRKIVLLFTTWNWFRVSIGSSDPSLAGLVLEDVRVGVYTHEPYATVSFRDGMSARNVRTNLRYSQMGGMCYSSSCSPTGGYFAWVQSTFGRYPDSHFGMWTPPVGANNTVYIDMCIGYDGFSLTCSPTLSPTSSPSTTPTKKPSTNPSIFPTTSMPTRNPVTRGPTATPSTSGPSSTPVSSSPVTTRPSSSPTMRPTNERVIVDLSAGRDVISYHKCGPAGCAKEKDWVITGACPAGKQLRMSVEAKATDFTPQVSGENLFVYVDSSLIKNCAGMGSCQTAYARNCMTRQDVSSIFGLVAGQTMTKRIRLQIGTAVNSCPVAGNYMDARVTIGCHGPPTTSPTRSPITTLSPATSQPSVTPTTSSPTTSPSTSSPTPRPTRTLVVLNLNTMSETSSIYRCGPSSCAVDKDWQVTAACPSGETLRLSVHPKITDFSSGTSSETLQIRIGGTTVKTCSGMGQCVNPTVYSAVCLTRMNVTSYFPPTTKISIRLQIGSQVNVCAQNGNYMDVKVTLGCYTPPTSAPSRNPTISVSPTRVPFTSNPTPRPTSPLVSLNLNVVTETSSIYKCGPSGCGVDKDWEVTGVCPSGKILGLSVHPKITDFSSGTSSETLQIRIGGTTVKTCSGMGQCVNPTVYSAVCLTRMNILSYFPLSASAPVKKTIRVQIGSQVNVCPQNGNYMDVKVTMGCYTPPTKMPSRTPTTRRPTSSPVLPETTINLASQTQRTYIYRCSGTPCSSLIKWNIVGTCSSRWFLSVSPRLTDFDGSTELLNVLIDGTTVKSCQRMGACKQTTYAEGACLNYQDVSSYLNGKTSAVIRLSITSAVNTCAYSGQYLNARVVLSCGIVPTNRPTLRPTKRPTLPPVIPTTLPPSVSPTPFAVNQTWNVTQRLAVSTELRCTTPGCSRKVVFDLPQGRCPKFTILSVRPAGTDFNSYYEYADVFVNGALIKRCREMGQCRGTTFSNRCVVNQNINSQVASGNKIEIRVQISKATNFCSQNGNYLIAKVDMRCADATPAPTMTPTRKPTEQRLSETEKIATYGSFQTNYPGFGARCGTFVDLSSQRFCTEAYLIIPKSQTNPGSTCSAQDIDFTTWRPMALQRGSSNIDCQTFCFLATRSKTCVASRAWSLTTQRGWLTQENAGATTSCTQTNGERVFLVNTTFTNGNSKYGFSHIGDSSAQTAAAFACEWNKLTQWARVFGFSATISVGNLYITTQKDIESVLEKSVSAMLTGAGIQATKINCQDVVVVLPDGTTFVWPTSSGARRLSNALNSAQVEFMCVTYYLSGLQGDSALGVFGSPTFGNEIAGNIKAQSQFGDVTVASVKVERVKEKSTRIVSSNVFGRKVSWLVGLFVVAVLVVV